jgi:uncharacterized membrane protein
MGVIPAPAAIAFLPNWFLVGRRGGSETAYEYLICRKKANRQASVPTMDNGRQEKMMLVARFLHILGFTVWIGGMFFAYMMLRPVAATVVQAPARLQLWEGVLGKFFFWVWLAIALILASGFYMMAMFGKPPAYVLVMFGLGFVMMLIFAHIFFGPYKRLKRAVAAQDWQAGAAALGKVGPLVRVNLILGSFTIAAGSLGPLLG